VNTPHRALVIGGGIAGMSAGIALARSGWSVDLVEKDREWRVYGAGISLTGPTLRAFDQLGVLPAIADVAYIGDGIDVFAVDGSFLMRIDPPRPAGADVPNGGGVLRPTLHRILSGHLLDAGVDVRLGVEVTRFDTRNDGVAVDLSDGSHENYDLAIGADGVFSLTRATLFPELPEPRYTGQVCWRVTGPRPPEVVRRRYYLGGPVKVGFSPVSDDEMYMFLLEATNRDIPRNQDLAAHLGSLLEGFGGSLADFREQLTPEADIVPRPLLVMGTPPPWYRGRVLLIGDAAHATTPHLASGAGLAVEDALVLAEELDRTPGNIDEALARFMTRRYSRVRLAVESSIEVGRREQAGESPQAQAAVVEQAHRALAAPI
jgi:2-polyprenyl-6-methoxyphenol hydroxylase-like FAD-dependent oxidoreductase